MKRVYELGVYKPAEELSEYFITGCNYAVKKVRVNFCKEFI
jgi:hypothetical protein